MDEVVESLFSAQTWWGRLLSRRWLRHVLYWSAIVVFFGFFWGSSLGNYDKLLLSEVVLLPGKIVAVYFCIYFLLPKYLLTRNYLAFFVYTIIAMLSLGLFQRIIVYNVLIGWNKVYPALPFWNPYEIMHLIIDINTVMVIPLGVRLLRIYYDEKYETKSQEKAKFEAELSFLKSQVNPHFLFNTLNNLYGLILKKSDKAGEVVLKLSDLMRYLLYETSAEKVELEKEIHHIKNFIELEKLRYGDRVDVGFNIYGSVSGRSIAPMILLHFIENSFKHGVSKALEKAWITIDFTIQDNSYLLRIENSKPEISGFINPNSADVFSGVGLKNVQRRLDILYKDQYKLKTIDETDSYTVVLEIRDKDYN